MNRKSNKIRFFEIVIAYILALWWIVLMGAATCVGVGWIEEPKGYLWGLFVGMCPMSVGWRWMADVFRKKLEEELSTEYKNHT